MSEALGHAPTTVRYNTYPQSFDIADGNFEDPEPPEITLVQDNRGRVDDVLTQDENQDATAIQMAFGNFEDDATRLPGAYQVTGSRLFEKGGGVYRIVIENQIADDGFNLNNTDTIVDIKLDVDGEPHWKAQGPTLDAEFQRRLDNLIAKKIAEAQLAA